MYLLPSRHCQCSTVGCGSLLFRHRLRTEARVLCRWHWLPPWELSGSQQSLVMCIVFSIILFGWCLESMVAADHLLSTRLNEF